MLDGYGDNNSFNKFKGYVSHSFLENDKVEENEDYENAQDVVSDVERENFFDGIGVSISMCKSNKLH